MIQRTLSGGLLALLCQLAMAQTSEYKTTFIIGDNVNVRADTSTSSMVNFKLQFGEECNCKRISKNWYAWDTGFTEGFISSKYVGEEETFVQRAEQLSNKNGTTLYSLLKHYVKTGDLRISDSLAIQIINSYKGKRFPVYSESCPFYGELAFHEVAKGDTSRNAANFCTKVVNQSKDPQITAFALHYLSKYSLLKKDYAASRGFIMKCIRDYGDNLIIQLLCDYDAYSKIWLMWAVKNLTFVLYYLGDVEFKASLREEISQMWQNNNHSEATRAVAHDLLTKLDGQFWGD
jgi:hypothetical protein